MRLPFLSRRHRPLPETPPEVKPRRLPPATSDTQAPDLTDLEDQARYHRDRAALYRARMHGSKPTSAARLEKLERASTAAGEARRGSKNWNAHQPRRTSVCAPLGA